MDKYPLHHARNILHRLIDVNYICHRYTDIAVSIRHSILLGRNRLGFVRVRLGIRELIEFLNRVTHSNVPRAVVLTAPTLEALQKEAKESLEFHVEGLMENGEDVPEWLKNGDYEFEYNIIR